MISKSNVRKGIFDPMSNELERVGFKFDKKNQFFVKKAQDAIFVYDIHFYHQTNIKSGEKGFLLEPYIWVIVKAVEKIYKEITVNKELKVDTDFLTLGNGVANLEANPDGINRKRNASLDLFVFEERNIKYVSWEILKHFRETAIPYFDNNQTVKAVDKLLNRQPKEYCVHMPNDTYRFIKGLIAAKLNNNEAFEQLLIEYSKLIIERDMPSSTREELNNLKKLLTESAGWSI